MGNPKMGLFSTMPTLLKPCKQCTLHCAQYWIVPTLVKQVHCTPLHNALDCTIFTLYYHCSDTINTSTAYRTGQYCIELVCIAFAATAHCPAPRDGLCLSGKVTPDNGETTGAKPTLREKKKKIGTAMKKRSLVHFKSRLPLSDKRWGVVSAVASW